jgi:hypothetical protein
MDRVLIVHENDAFRELLQATLRKELGDAASLDAWGAYEGLAEQMSGDPRCRLAVLGAEAPAQEGMASDYEHHAGVKKFLEDAGARRPDAVLLVLATGNDDALCRMSVAHPRGRLAIVAPGGDWRSFVRQCAREAFGIDCRRIERRTRTVLRIRVSSHSRGVWTMERRGPVQETRDGILDLDPVDFHDLCIKSEALVQQFEKFKWGDCLPQVSNDIYRMIFRRPKNEALLRAFDDALSDPDGPERLRMVFDLSTDSHVIPVETLKQYQIATSVDQWYALASAILREYEGDGPQTPLFWDAESRTAPIDCLLVAANPRAGSKADGELFGKLVALPQVNSEIRDIVTLLTAQKDAGANIGKIVPLELSNSGEDAQHVLAEALASHPWKLVHFAGHAVVESGAGDHPPTGSLMLFPAPEGKMDFAAFARNIPHVQFLFVSSCRSANQAFLQEAMRQSLPAVLGYRWPVDDDQARQLAKDFYEALFDPRGKAFRSLGRALACARRKVFSLYPSDVTWASPLLLTKGSRSTEFQAADRARNEAMRPWP